MTDYPMPRLSWWMWLLHPIQAYWIMFLVREASRYRGEQAHRTAATNAEKVVVNRALTVGRKEMRAALRRIEALVAAQQSALLAAERERARREVLPQKRYTPKTNTDAVVIPPLTASEATTLLTRMREKVDTETQRGDTRHLDAPSKTRRVVAHGLLAVDVAAIFSLFSVLFNIDFTSVDPQKLVTAGGFSFIAAGVLGMMAHSTGHMVWKWKVTAPVASRPEVPARSVAAPTPAGEFPPRKLLLVSKLLGLGVVSVLSGFSILIRVVTEADGIGHPLIGWCLGLLVGVAAAAAPWLVVIDEMRSGSIETRTVDALTKMVQDVENASTSHMEKAGDYDERAADLYQRATKAVNATRGRCESRRARAEKIILTARSLHTGAGRYAVAEEDINTPTGTRDVLGPIFDMDTTRLNEALGRMRPPPPVPEVNQPSVRSVDDNPTESNAA